MALVTWRELALRDTPLEAGRLGCVQVLPGEEEPTSPGQLHFIPLFPPPQLLTQGGGVTLSSKSLWRE